ncbi:MAG: geranylgeranylglycerol-phosphate geranylgeranyltransferase [Bacteroidales bacterium]|nr:geranylgeranylglycerol-phosphate geranylgeranyltransferase [Bacteroidales bacterium]
MWLLRLIRWPNLLIIILTQVLVKYCLVSPYLDQAGVSSQFAFLNFMLLIFVTVLLAAAGYIINDYFDLRIDRINKPSRMILGKSIEARQGILLHWIMNGVAVLLGFYLAYRVGTLKLGLVFPIIATLLWLYSARYKRSFLIGNVLVSFLSALVVLVVWLFEYYMLHNLVNEHPVVFSELSIVVGFYAAFAFLVSLVREIVKDIEDIEGDTAAGCKTIPVRSGIGGAKNIALALSLFTMLVLAAGQYLLLQQGLKIIFWYYLIPVQLLMINLLLQINKAVQPPDFRAPGKLAKIIMVAGILGMQLFSLTL